MLKRLVALAFVAALTFVAGGSAPAAAEIDHPFGVEFAARMKESLALTDDQVARLEPVIMARIDKVDAALAALEGAKEPDVAGFIEEYGAIRKEFEAGVMKVLTVDQRAPWASFKADFEKDLVQAGATRQLDELQAALKLSDDQVTRLRPALVTNLQKKLDLLQEMSEDSTINVREKRIARRQLDELNAELDKSIHAVLTLDQRSAYKALTKP